MPSLIRTPVEITADWLGEVLGRPGLELTAIERIGTGQMSQSHRVSFRPVDGAESPRESVVIKLASDDPTSRATGVGMGAYFREIAFYRNVAERIGDPLPRCHLATYDRAEGWFTLVLEDVADATQGDQIAGCSMEEARIALRQLARVHAPVLGDAALSTAEYLNQPHPLNQDLLTALLPGFIERYGDRVAPEHQEVCRRLVAVLDAWSAERVPPLGLVHGDYRLDNLLFGNGTCKVVDWQTVSWGPALLDAAYFIGGCLRVDDRRAHDRELVRLYHEELQSLGVTSLSWDQCWDQYRRQCFHGILMAVAAPMVVERTKRGDDMFMTWLARNAQQVLDLDALSLLPARSTARPRPLRPNPADEGRHPPGPEPLWNESWYFDAISDDRSLALYVRLGRLPNQTAALYTASVCGPGRPSLMLVDTTAPLPDADDDHQRIDTERFHAEQHCQAPLERFSVVLRGIAEAHADHSAPLRAETGEPIEARLDLLWETDGIPYAWRQTTRYELPCRVSGMVEIGEEQIEFAGVGQRDHSWGSRDWWAVDWMWSALHFEDGTHTHAVAIPQMPGFGVGYVQREGSLVEISSARATEEIRGDGLIAHAHISADADPQEIEVEPMAFGALRLEAPDGRLSLFPRAMCRVRADDGRTGVGWVEWNRVQRT